MEQCHRPFWMHTICAPVKYVERSSLLGLMAHAQHVIPLAELQWRTPLPSHPIQLSCPPWMRSAPHGHVYSNMFHGVLGPSGGRHWLRLQLKWFGIIQSKLGLNGPCCPNVSSWPPLDRVSPTRMRLPTSPDKGVSAGWWGSKGSFGLMVQVLNRSAKSLSPQTLVAKSA